LFCFATALQCPILFIKYRWIGKALKRFSNMNSHRFKTFGAQLFEMAQYSPKVIAYLNKITNSPLNYLQKTGLFYTFRDLKTTT